MIGSKEQQPALYDNWTFCDKGFKFFIRKNKNLLKFKLHNVFSGEWYESEDVELQRINEQTIKAAFDPKVSMVSYYLTEKAQNEATLTFKVKMQFLTSEFSEDINLKKLKMNAQQAEKLQLEQLSQQISQAQRMLQQTLRSKDNLIYQTNTNIRTNQNPLFKLKIDAGKYLFELSGFYFTQRLYDECNGYDQYGNDMYGGVDPLNVERNAAIILSLKLNGVEALTLTSTRPNYCQAYEYPYSFSFIIEIKETCEVKFDCMDTNKEYLLMNHNNLIIRPI